MQNIETKLLDELNKNPSCCLGILNNTRLFVQYNTNQNVQEILILIDSYDLWTHVFHYESYWYTTLIIFSAALDAKDITDLFKNFWYRIDLANKDINSLFWCPADDSHGKYKAIYKNTCFDSSLKDLVNIISNYRSCDNDLDTGECDHYWQVKQLYENANTHCITQSF